MQSSPSMATYSWKTINPNARCVYIRDLEQANTEVALLTPGPVGFDLEWRPSFLKGEQEHPVSLVQISNDETVLLIQVSAMHEFPLKLQEFLENPDIVKAGVAIQNDTKKLYKDHQVSTRCCVDLSLLAKCVENAHWKGKYNNPIGLARLVEYYENLSLKKGKITRSNWTSELTDAQLEYASNDAHAGYTIYKKLFSMIPSMSTIPKSVYYTFDSIRGRLCEPSGMQWNPFNPEYDPGPPPPPRTPAIPMATNVTIAATSNAGNNMPSMLLASTSIIPHGETPQWDNRRIYTHASSSNSSRNSQESRDLRQQYHPGPYSYSRSRYADSMGRTSEIASVGSSSSLHLDRNVDTRTAGSVTRVQPESRPHRPSALDKAGRRPRYSRPQQALNQPTVARNFHSGYSSSHADGANSSTHTGPSASEPIEQKKSRRRPRHRRPAHDLSTTEGQGNDAS